MEPREAEKGFGAESPGNSHSRAVGTPCDSRRSAGLFRPQGAPGFGPQAGLGGSPTSPYGRSPKGKNRRGAGGDNCDSGKAVSSAQRKKAGLVINPNVPLWAKPQRQESQRSRRRQLRFRQSRFIRATQKSGRMPGRIRHGPQGISSYPWGFPPGWPGAQYRKLSCSTVSTTFSALTYVEERCTGPSCSS